MNERELKALISLLDDPDQIIQEEIERKLLSLGTGIVPSLEEYWEKSFNPITQKRLEDIIHHLEFEQVKNDLQIWKMSNPFDLLQGLLIINRYQYPALEESKIIFQISELQREVWMEMSYDMSPKEKIKLLNHVLFFRYGLSGNTSNYHSPDNSYISKVLETKKGNPISLACIYSIIAQKLDIPIYGINLPKHFVLGYTNHLSDSSESKEVLFYSNVFNKGQIMALSDIFSFLRQMNMEAKPEFIAPCDNIAIIRRVLRNLISCYKKAGNTEKQLEVELLLNILND